MKIKNYIHEIKSLKRDNAELLNKIEGLENDILNNLDGQK